jgi:hypothetical protein
MKNLSINRAPRILILFTFCILFLLGCKSTPEEDIEAKCRTDTNDNCSGEDNNGGDRGYNPCLVNKNLPVCKK